MTIKIDWEKPMTLVVEVVQGVPERQLDVLRSLLGGMSRDHRVSLSMNTIINDKGTRLAIDIRSPVSDRQVRRSIEKLLDPRHFNFRQNPLYDNS